MIFFIILFKFFIYLCPFSSFVFIEVFKHGRNIEEAAKGESGIVWVDLRLKESISV